MYLEATITRSAGSEYEQQIKINAQPLSLLRFSFHWKITTMRRPCRRPKSPRWDCERSPYRAHTIWMSTSFHNVKKEPELMAYWLPKNLLNPMLRNELVLSNKRKHVKCAENEKKSWSYEERRNCKNHTVSGLITLVRNSLPQRSGTGAMRRLLSALTLARNGFRKNLPSMQSHIKKSYGWVWEGVQHSNVYLRYSSTWKHTQHIHSSRKSSWRKKPNPYTYSTPQRWCSKATYSFFSTCHPASACGAVSKLCNLYIYIYIAIVVWIPYHNVMKT